MYVTDSNIAAIAEAFRISRGLAPNWQDHVSDTADLLEAEVPDFNRILFLRACNGLVSYDAHGEEE